VAAARGSDGRTHRILKIKGKRNYNCCIFGRVNNFIACSDVIVKIGSSEVVTRVFRIVSRERRGRTNTYEITIYQPVELPRHFWRLMTGGRVYGFLYFTYRCWSARTFHCTRDILPNQCRVWKWKFSLNLALNFFG